MPEVISVDDINQLFGDSCCKYKGDPVHFEQCDRTRTATFTYLEFGKRASAKFDLKDFRPHEGPIGFINHGHLAFYATRIPVRQYSQGLTKENTTFAEVAYKHILGPDRRQAIHEAMQLDNKAVFAALKNQYPPVEKAAELAKKHNGVYAFHRQFAVDAGGNVFYKTVWVGKILDGKKEIKFNPGKEYLINILADRYEETARTFKA